MADENMTDEHHALLDGVEGRLAIRNIFKHAGLRLVSTDGQNKDMIPEVAEFMWHKGFIAFPPNFRPSARIWSNDTEVIEGATQILQELHQKFMLHEVINLRGALEQLELNQVAKNPNRFALKLYMAGLRPPVLEAREL